jgi:2-keto-4-pentenoate hydratase/2-oxohepta-3-ene-1,7-dioic acid hydratase in catechol pathway
MRIVQYVNGGQQGCGVEVDEDVFYTGYDSAMALILDGERGLERAASAAGRNSPVEYERLIAPLVNPHPGKIFGSGVNYWSHGDEDPDYEFADEIRWDFLKLPSAIIGPGEPIVIPPADDVIVRQPGGNGPLREYGFAVDYEVEFGVVIGKPAKNVREDEALDYIFGYTVLNDVGARSVQFHNAQIDLGKNFDTFCPMGPCIVTKDEIPDWGSVRVQSFVNGEQRQSAQVNEQIGPPPTAIEWLSSIITLHPGDCLSTGTPAGCGTFLDPPQFLNPGDVVTVSASGIGELTNPVVEGTSRTRPKA